MFFAPFDFIEDPAMVRTSVLASVAALAVMASPLAAQDISAARQALFQQMLADPANREVMTQYARLAVQERDFEGAASTLERLVDLEPLNTTARVELAIAYFALGSYAVAEYHLVAAQTSGTLTPEQAAQVARYRDASADRDDRSDYSGRLQVGYAFADTTGEEGSFVNGAVDWRVDLGDAHATQWVTEFAFSTYEPGDGSINARTSARLRTGPEFRIARDAYGPRLQPYIEIGHFSNDDTLPGDYYSVALGAAYANPINERFTVYADLSAGREYARNTGDADFEFAEFDLGVTYRPSRDTRFRLQGTLEDREAVDSATADEFSTASVRLSVQHAFDPGFQALPNRWVTGAFAEIGQSERTLAGTVTEFEENSYGAFLRAFVFEDIFIETAAAQVMEDTTTGGGTTTRDDMIYTVQIGWEF